MAKYIYAKHREWKTRCPFGRDLYYHHLEVWNQFWEYEPPKNGFEAYFNAFDCLLDDIKLNGFNASHAVPRGSNGVICNGAHRVTSCVLYNKKLTVQDLPEACDAYDFRYFQERGLDSKYLDAMALQYCELKPNSYILTIFPSAVGHAKKVERIIKNYAHIVYKKEIPFTVQGGFQLILTAYEHEPFVQEGRQNSYRSARNKAKACFPENLTASNPVRVYLLEADGLALIQACKTKIRAIFKIGNDCLHSTDTHFEAIVLARALFNQNSVHCLNHRKETIFPQFECYFETYRAWLTESQKDSDWFCIDSGAVLAAYGLRECHDLDILHYAPMDFSCGIDGIESHNSELPHHALSLDDILFDPDNYFYYRGVKFCSLQVLKQMKERRAEPKDLYDLGLIEQIESSK